MHSLAQSHDPSARLITVSHLSQRSRVTAETVQCEWRHADTSSTPPARVTLMNNFIIALSLNGTLFTRSQHFRARSVLALRQLTRPCCR